MTPRNKVHVLTPQTTSDEAISFLLTRGISGAPVVDPDSGKLMGIISSSDFMFKDYSGALLNMEGSEESLKGFVEVAQKICGTTVEELMSCNVFTIADTEPMAKAADIMARRNLHRLVVVDPKDEEKLVGILTRSDVMRDVMTTVRAALPEHAAASSSLLPDYGTTSVDIDKIRLSRAKKWRREDLFGNSLVDQTLDDLTTDQDFQITQQRLKTQGAAAMTKEERLQRRRALDDLGILSFESFLQQQLDTSVPFTLKRKVPPKVLQINIGLYCNQACAHCHVESSPLRTEEQMTTDICAQCLELLKSSPSITTLDITGGAPELNPAFRYLVSCARAMRGEDLEIIDRCNLTVLQEPGQEDLVAFLKEHKVRVVASLPCYSAENVDQQRGNGVFERSIAALLALNEAGYGHPGSGLVLDLVYNPLGAFLPPDQTKLQAKYKEELDENFGILFDSLFTMTNMPIKRFADFLYRRGELKEYMDLLQRNFNKDTMKTLMCYETISIGYDGKMYDCDFNQQLGYKIGAEKDDDAAKGMTVFDIDSFEKLQGQAILTDNHCFGCTAGMGSSWQGTTA